MVSSKKYPLPPVLKKLFDRFGKWLAWGAAGWLSLSFIGYGIALIRYSSKIAPDSATSAAALRPDEGVISWSDAGLFTGLRGAHFKMKNRETITFEIPSEFIKDRENAKDIEDRLTPENDIWFKATKDDNKVIGMVVNPRSAKEKTLVYFDFTEKVLAQQTASVSRGGIRNLMIGLLILPLFWLVLRFKGRFRR